MGRQRTGSVVNRDGVFFARVTYVDEFGKRKEVTRKALDRADARRIVDELHARIDQRGDAAVLNDRSTLADVIERYRQEKAKPALMRDGKKISGLKSSYVAGLYLDILTEYLGKKRLRDIGQFPNVLKTLLKQYGSVSAMARRFRVDRANLDKAIRGQRRPSAALLQRIGVTQKLVYEMPRVINDSK
ncbi:MAG TPA: hypothetical protein VI479_14855 [Blastocatellia bacterium]